MPYAAFSVAEVVMLVFDTFDQDVLRLLRHIRRTSSPRTVLVTTHIDSQKLVSAAEYGVTGLVRRTEASGFTPSAVVHVEVVDRRGLPEDHTVAVTYNLDAVIEIYRERVDPAA
ncbi:hypothetical protein [Streptomyces sp. NPDC002671]